MPSVTNGNTITSTAQIGDGVIVDADINASAAIAKTKLAALHIVDADIDAHTTTKITVPSTLLTVASQAQGDIIYFNGTNWVRLAAGTSGNFLKTLGANQNPAWASAGATVKSGQASKALADASTAQTIAHGLGVTPKLVLFDSSWLKNATVGHRSFMHGAYDGTNQQCFWYVTDGSANDEAQSTTAGIVLADATQGVNQSGVVTFDATNITITWTKAGSPTGTVWFRWSAFA